MVSGREQDVAPVSFEAGGKSQVYGRAVSSARYALVGLELHAVQVGSRDDVDDAAHGVGTVDRGSAVLEHLNPFNNGGWQGVEIDRAVRAEAAGHESAAIHQDQGPLGTQPAQADAGGPVAAVIRLGIGGVGLDRERLEDVPHGGESPGPDVLAGQDDHRGRRAFRLAPDPGTGHRQFFEDVLDLKGIRAVRVLGEGPGTGGRNE